MHVQFATPESEYAKDEQITKEDIAAFRQWVEKQPHLPKISDHKLILFFQSCYYRLEPAKAALDNFYTVRTHCPQFFANRNVNSAELQRDMKVGLITLLPQPSLQKNSIMFVKILDTNVDAFNFNQLAKLFDMAVSLKQALAGTTPGQGLVMDMAGASFGHLTRTSITSVKMLLYFLQEALPVRIKELHIINVSPLTDKFIAVAKPFVKKELMKMLKLHSKMNTLYEYIAKDALPNEYGGKAGTFKELQDRQIKNWLDHAAYFEEEEKQLVDESKRQGKLRNVDEMFGVVGSFKKLDID